MADTGPAVILDPPPLTPPPYGLLKTAAVIDHTDDIDDSRWINGIKFQPENFEDITSFDPCGDTSDIISTFTDGVTTAGSGTFTSATGDFTADDIGKSVTTTTAADASKTDGSSTQSSTTFTSASIGFNANDVGKTISSTATANANYTDGVINTDTGLVSATAAFSADDVGKTVTGTVNETFADGVTNTDTSLVSATANFTSADVGKTVSGTGIFAGSTISSVTNATTVVLSHVTTATATGVSFTIAARKCIASSTTISSVTNATTVVLSGATLATATGVAFTITARKAIFTGTTIASVTNATTAVLSPAAQATAASQTFTITARLVLDATTTITAVGSKTSVTISPVATATSSAVTFTIPNRAPELNGGGTRFIHPFGLEARQTCSAFTPALAADRQGRALRRLAAQESKGVEREFATAAIRATNPHLQDATNTQLLNGGSAVGLRQGLELLVQAIADNNLGIGMIHARPSLVTAWSTMSDLFIVQNGKLYTYSGNLVVSGSGYTGASPSGTAPTATSEWAYATEVLQIHRGPPEVFAPEPVSSSNLDIAANLVTIRAQRMYAVVGNFSGIWAVQINRTAIS